MDSYTANHIAPSLPSGQQMIEDLTEEFTFSNNRQTKKSKEDYDSFIHHHDQLKEYSGTMNALNESLVKLNDELQLKTLKMKEKVSQ